VEIVFSAFKRVLGETLQSRRFLSQKAEASLKVIIQQVPVNQKTVIRGEELSQPSVQVELSYRPLASE